MYLCYLIASNRRWLDYFSYCFLRKHDWNEGDEHWTGFCEFIRYKNCNNCGAILRD